jgi:very-short-patch-repair endonuclease
VTPVPATLLGLADQIEFRELRRALAEALYRGITDLGSVRSVLGQGHVGSNALRAAIASYEPRLARTRSVLERRFIELCERERIPLPAVNVKVAGFTVDALWADRRVAVELDSQGAHGTPIAIADDRRRDLALRSAGHQVLRYTWEQVTERAAEVAADLRSALATAGADRES